MTISNLGDLKRTITDWLDRADLESHIPDFIAFAEQRIHYGAAQGDLMLDPLRLQAMVKDIPAVEKPTGVAEDDITDWLELVPGTSDKYYAKFPALVKDEDTNWLLTNAPDAYLFAALVEAAIFCKNRAASEEYLIRYASTALNLVRQDQRMRAAWETKPGIIKKVPITVKSKALQSRKIADRHLKTVRKTFDLLRQSDLDDNPVYAAFEWLFDCRKDLLAALENIENDAGQIPEHAWKVIQDAIAAAGGKS